MQLKLNADISNIPSVRMLIETALQKDVRDIVLSPGSRNAPLIISFNAIDAFNCISVVDERTAGFMALGMAQQTKKPVVICCTSGSALLNYAPAIAEAYHQHIPLIVLAADRPKEWIGQGEGQSIAQSNVLNGVLAHTAELVNGDTENDQWYNRRQVQNAFEITKNESRPVLINMPFNEPLYETEAWAFNGGLKQISFVGNQHEISSEEMSQLKQSWSEKKKVMIIVGQNQFSSKLEQQLKLVFDDSRVAVLTETSANLYHFGFVSCIDRTLEIVHSKDESKDFVSDLLITIGTNLISKKLKAFLRSNKSEIQEHWHFGADMMDTFQTLTHWIKSDPAEAIARLRMVETDLVSGFNTAWKGAFFKAEQIHQQYLETVEYSDLKVFQTILDLIPNEWMLQMGNSSVVRYIQLFNQLQGVTYFGNRGVSGIEGCTSTAVGAAMKSNRDVLFISGDHAFRYDANGLSFENIPDNLKIIVINNDGGNIFRIIDGPQGFGSSDDFIEHTQHKSVKKLVEYHGIEYRAANDIESLEKEMIELIDGSAKCCRVLEVFTPREVSPEVLKSYFKFISSI
jgi:2-succinyl-5-enolpyruvyl-6-hydroxy-3-cyclohexene-1-carboxylate synthase